MHYFRSGTSFGEVKATCAVISWSYGTESITLPNPYPGKTTAYGGTVDLEFVDTSVNMGYALSGVESECVNYGGGNSCGIHSNIYPYFLT